jgi:hypothetical protein
MGGVQGTHRHFEQARFMSVLVRAGIAALVWWFASAQNTQASGLAQNDVAWPALRRPSAEVRIPRQPATYSDLDPATLSDAAPVELWARRPSPIAARIQCRSALSTSPQAGRGLPRRGGRLLIGIGARNISEFAVRRRRRRPASLIHRWRGVRDAPKRPELHLQQHPRRVLPELRKQAAPARQPAPSSSKQANPARASTVSQPRNGGFRALFATRHQIHAPVTRAAYALINSTGFD